MSSKSPARSTLGVLLLAGGFFFLAGLPAGAAPETTWVYFNDTFEQPGWTVGDRLSRTPNDGWTGSDNNSTSTVQIKDARRLGGSQSLYLRDGDKVYSSNATKDWNFNITEGYFEFLFRSAKSPLDDSGSGNFAINFLNTGATTRNFGLTWSDVDGFSVINAFGGKMRRIGYSKINYIPDTWTTIRITFNEATDSASVSINGVVIPELTVSSEETNVLWHAGKVQIVTGYSTATGHSGYFDDITAVAKVPAAATVAR